MQKLIDWPVFVMVVCQTQQQQCAVRRAHHGDVSCSKAISDVKTSSPRATSVMIFCVALFNIIRTTNCFIRHAYVTYFRSTGISSEDSGRPETKTRYDRTSEYMARVCVYVQSSRILVFRKHNLNSCLKTKLSVFQTSSVSEFLIRRIPYYITGHGFLFSST